MLIFCARMCSAGWVDGWVDGWMGGWMDGSESRVKDCLQQSKKIKICGFFEK